MNLKITPSKDAQEITIRKGDTLPARAPRTIVISGTLCAPYEFLSGKPTLATDVENIHLLIDRASDSLTLYVKDQDPHTTHVISGKLKRETVLDLFRINSDKRWTVSEFVKFIKTMRYYFSEKSEVDSIVESLNKWSVKVETIIQENRDNAGNSLTMLEKKVGEVVLKRKFSLSLALFQGYSKIKFTVEIGLDPKTNSVDLYLISDELIEEELKLKESIFKTELEKFSESKFSKVTIS